MSLELKMKIWSQIAGLLLGFVGLFAGLSSVSTHFAGTGGIAFSIIGDALLVAYAIAAFWYIGKSLGELKRK